MHRCESRWMAMSPLGFREHLIIRRQQFVRRQRLVLFPMLCTVPSWLAVPMHYNARKHQQHLFPA